MNKKDKNFPNNLKTIPEYSELLPPLTKKKFKQLLENIKKDGHIYSPIVIDENGVILDGHSRYKIAEILDMTFTIVVQNVDSIKKGKMWIIDNQIGRRSMKDVIKTSTSHLKRLIATGTDNEVVDELKKVFGDDIIRIAEYLRILLPGKETAAMVLLVCKCLEKDTAITN